MFQRLSTSNNPQSTITHGDLGLSLNVSCSSSMSRTRAPSITCLQKKKIESLAVDWLQKSLASQRLVICRNSHKMDFLACLQDCWSIDFSRVSQFLANEGHTHVNSNMMWIENKVNQIPHLLERKCLSFWPLKRTICWPWDHSTLPYLTLNGNVQCGSLCQKASELRPNFSLTKWNKTSQL